MSINQSMDQSINQSITLKYTKQCLEKWLKSAISDNLKRFVFNWHSAMATLSNDIQLKTVKSSTVHSRMATWPNLRWWLVNYRTTSQNIFHCLIDNTKQESVASEVGTALLSHPTTKTTLHNLRNDTCRTAMTWLNFMSWYDDTSWHEVNFWGFNLSLHEKSHKWLITLVCWYLVSYKYTWPCTNRNIGQHSYILRQLLVC